MALAFAACGGGPRTATPIQEAVTTPSPATPLTPSAVSSDPGAIAARFDAQQAMEHVRTLAQPPFMGRHTGTPGEELGARYLTDQFHRFGLEPAGDNGTYIQQVPLTVTELSAVPVLTLVDTSARERPLRLRDDFRPLIAEGAGPGNVEGPGIFAGTGDFSSVDVRGKVVVVVPRGSLGELIRNARAAGALALIVTTGQETLLKGEAQGQPSPGALPVALLSTRGAAAILEGSGHSREELNQMLRAGERLPSFPLAFRLRLNFQTESRSVQAKNVLALLPAAQPSDETYIVGAHYEEIGPDPDGVVYPAANDNASGTAVMLEIAHLLGEEHLRPRVNVLFVGWSGHEEGLRGSAYYVTHPAFPLTRTLAYLNLDTVGQGSGSQLLADASDDSVTRSLETALDRLQAATGSRPPVRISRQSEGASDHLNFLQRGVPAIDFNWTGILEGGRIHTPADDANNVDPAKLKVTGQVATAALLVALAAHP